MAFKSVYEVEVRDEAFKKLVEETEKYRQGVRDIPADWAASMDGLKGAVEGLHGTLSETHETLKKITGEGGQVQDKAAKAAGFWQSIGKSASSTLNSVTGITRSLLSWTGIAGFIGGALGFGGLFGLERLAYGTANARSGAQGIGTSIGAQRAFETNYKRVLGDPEGLLSKVSAAQNDPGEWSYFARLGIKDFQNKDPAELAAQVVAASKAAFGKDFVSAQATGAGHFLGAGDARRLVANDLGASETGFRKDLSFLDVNDAAAKKWQDFSVRMTEAGYKIEGAFAGGLANLAPQLDHLTESLIKLVDTASHSEKVAHWIDELSGALERLSNWLGDHSESQSSAPSYDPNDPYDSRRAGAGDDQGGIHVIHRTENTTAWQRLKGLFSNSHNPGNLRSWGDRPVVNGFAQFDSDEQGYGALAKQLKLYEDRDHLDTVEKIITKYAPPNENDTASYIRGVMKETGFGVKEHLNLQDPEVLSKLVLAITKREGQVGVIPDKQFIINIINSTGSNVTTNAKQASVTSQ